MARYGGHGGHGVAETYYNAFLCCLKVWTANVTTAGANTLAPNRPAPFMPMIPLIREVGLKLPTVTSVATVRDFFRFIKPAVSRF